jgi:hypothetical protein
MTLPKIETIDDKDDDSDNSSSFIPSPKPLFIPASYRSRGFFNWIFVFSVRHVTNPESTKPESTVKPDATEKPATDLREIYNCRPTPQHPCDPRYWIEKNLQSHRRYGNAVSGSAALA